MNEELIKEAEEKLYSLPTRGKYQQLAIVDEFIEKATLAERKRCADIARSIESGGASSKDGWRIANVNE